MNGITNYSANYSISCRGGRNIPKRLPRFAAYAGKPIPEDKQYFDHSLLLGNQADMKLHIRKLEKYLSENPDDIEVRNQLEKLREMFQK